MSRNCGRRGSCACDDPAQRFSDVVEAIVGNRLRHDYDTIDIVRIWLLLERDLPQLKTVCRQALRRLREEAPKR